MYVNPFWTGVLCGVLFTFCGFIALAIYFDNKKRR